MHLMVYLMSITNIYMITCPSTKGDKKSALLYTLCIQYENIDNTVIIIILYSRGLHGKLFRQSPKYSLKYIYSLKAMQIPLSTRLLNLKGL